MTSRTKPTKSRTFKRGWKQHERDLKEANPTRPLTSGPGFFVSGRFYGRRSAFERRRPIFTSAALLSIYAGVLDSDVGHCYTKREAAPPPHVSGFVGLTQGKSALRRRRFGKGQIGGKTINVEQGLGRLAFGRGFMNAAKRIDALYKTGAC